MVKRVRHIGKGWTVTGNFLVAHGGLLVCGLFLLAGLRLAGDYGLGVNELYQRDTVKATLGYILGQAEGVETIVSNDRFYGVSFELPLLLAERALGLDSYYYAHWFRLTATHLFFLVGGFFCYLLAWRLFNNRLIALFAVLLFLLHPRIYAHSFFNSKDLPFLSMFVIALYLLERAFRRDTAGAFLLLGVAVGIATNLRIMGLMLFLAVIGMRVLDTGLARGWGERKRILATGGLFTVAAGLAWYGVAPNAWSDPLGQLAGGLDLTTNHPAIKTVLFQGEIFRSDELPAHYGLTWFVITAPAAVLLLGAVGIALALAKGLVRPGAVLVNGRLRFWLLLTGCFGLPLLAVALAGSNIFSGWRHLYFIYVPFALLAAGGLGWVAGSWLRPRRWRVGIYGLSGLGMGLTLLQMAQLHPLQHIYFDFLVDRTTPNQLRGSYEMDYRRLAPEAGLAYLLERHPGETLAAGAWPWRASVLPPKERRRLIMASPVHDLDYVWRDMPERARHPDAAFNTFYLKWYDNPVVIMRVLEGSRMTAAMRAGYTELYRAAVDGEPIIRGEYDVYLEGRRVTFVEEDCQRGERAGRFRVKVYRAAVQSEGVPDLAVYDHNANYGARVGGRCLVVIQLRDYPPDYQIAHLVVGRYIGGEARRAIWEAAHSFSRPGLEEIAAKLGDNQPGATEGAGFELYRQGKRLIYYRDGCAAGDTAAPFFLHITPEDTEDLSPERRDYGFDSWGFHFGQRGLRLDGQCLATVELPDYAIAGIRTGQEGYWDFRGNPPVEPGFLRERAVALAGAAADFRGEFDLYWRDGELIYRREGCAVADTAAGFFLHITPVDGGDLAAKRREYGFEGRDFEFSKWGGHFDGSCLAVVPLPEYEIAGLRTGQYVAGQGEVWSVELGPP